MTDTLSRYATHATELGHYVLDTLDDRLIGDAQPSKFEAELAAERLNRMNRLRASLFQRVDLERRRQDSQHPPVMGSAEHLAILTKKVGDAASTLLSRQPRERALEQELVEAGAVILRWLEHIEVTR